MSPSSVSQLALLGRLLSHAYYFSLSLSLSLLNSSFFSLAFLGILKNAAVFPHLVICAYVCACVRVHIGNAILSVRRLNSCVVGVLMRGIIASYCDEFCWLAKSHL